MRTISPFLVIDDNTTKCKEWLDKMTEVKYDPKLSTQGKGETNLK
jgi:hypothetical protein